jgi:hypothetical protein
MPPDPESKPVHTTSYSEWYYNVHLTPRELVLDILSQVLGKLDDPHTDDQERISFTRLKLSFLLDWLRQLDKERNAP